MSSFANDPKILAAIPGLSGIPKSVIFESFLLNTIPLTFLFSNFFELSIFVPITFLKLDFTHKTTLLFFARIVNI